MIRYVAAQHLLFEVSGLPLAAPAELIKTIHEELSVQAVAGTHTWFRGLAVANGKLLPVTDIGAFCGRSASTGRTLELADSVGISGLQVDTVVGLSDAPVTEVPLADSDLPHIGGDNLALSTRAIVHGEHVHRLLDVAALVQSAAFLNIAETNH